MRKKTQFRIESEDVMVTDCQFCSQEVEVGNLTEVHINPRISLAVSFSDTLGEILERRENKDWVFDREPATMREGAPIVEDVQSYNPKMVRLSVADMMDIFEEAKQLHSDGSMKVCEYCAKNLSR